MIPDDRDERHPDAVLEHLGRRVHLRLDDDDDRRLGAGCGIVGEFADAARHEHADVRLVQPVARSESGGPHRVAKARRDLGIVKAERSSVSISADWRRRRMWRSKRNGCPL